MIGARLTWTLWGAATIAMTWATAPTDSRTIATGITVLAWTAASTLALHGWTLRPSAFVHVHTTPPPSTSGPRFTSRPRPQTASQTTCTHSSAGPTPCPVLGLLATPAP